MAVALNESGTPLAHRRQLSASQPMNDINSGMSLALVRTLHVVQPISGGDGAGWGTRGEIRYGRTVKGGAGTALFRIGGTTMHGGWSPMSLQPVIGFIQKPLA